MGEQTPTSVRLPAAKMAEVYLKRRKAAEMRRSGHSWDEVAEACGYASRGSAHDAVRVLLREERSLAIDEVSLLRIESLARYTDLLKALWPRAMKGDDKAVAESRRLIERMDKLNGTEAPIKHEFGEGDIDATLRELEAELGRRAAAAQVQASRRQTPAS